MSLPTVSETLLSVQKRTSGLPSRGTRASAVKPYSITWPDLVRTWKRSGPEPALPSETILAKLSISVRYSVPSAPYAPETATSRCPSRQKRSSASKFTPPTAPSCAMVR